MTTPRVETLVVGAGQAGLAASRCLAERGADHLVVERGRVAERWRTARWDSLRLITPNWMSRLPGWSYPGPNPEGYMSAPELASYLQCYAGSGAAPVRESTTVELLVPPQFQLRRRRGTRRPVRGRSPDPGHSAGTLTTMASWVDRAITTTASVSGDGFSSRCGACGGTQT